jgi:hypothetical protein
MASDGNYYPPELRPNYQAPPQVLQRFSPQGLPSSQLKGTKITIRRLWAGISHQRFFLLYLGLRLWVPRIPSDQLMPQADTGE